MGMLVDFAIFPLDKGESVSTYVARVVKIIRETGLAHTLGPMGTCIEGEWHEVMALVTRCFEELSKESDRIYFTIKADYRRDAAGRIRNKVKSIESKLA